MNCCSKGVDEMADIIKVEHLSYVYNPGLPTAVTALDDVSFTVEEGDFVGIIGATGSGKSTLITHMNGLNKPTSGHIIIDGRDLWAEPEKIREFRFLTGLVFQYPEYQLFEETCYKDIAFGPRNMGLDEAEVDRRVREAAHFVGLRDEQLEKSPFELSGGQKRRVAVAGVMAMKPRILVLDEPAAGLDPEGRDEILSEASSTVVPVFLWYSFTSERMSSRPSGSRPAAGSSSTRMRGFMAMTPATATRRF